MATVPIQEAQARLGELIHALAPGEVLTITEGDRPLAQLVSVSGGIARARSGRARPPVTGVPRAGSCEGLIVVGDDFEEPLEELREYME